MKQLRRLGLLLMVLLVLCGIAAAQEPRYETVPVSIEQGESAGKIN